jgi:hypothetical protein
MLETIMKINKEHVAYLEENYGKNILPLSIFENEAMIGKGPNEMIFFYKKKAPILKHKENLLKTIEHYNLFSSRLIMIDNNKFALQYCIDGAVLNDLPPINATSNDISMQDIKRMMVHVKTLPGEPLFAVTGIPVRDGILCAISCSHTVADGISMLLFLYAWMCVTEGKSFLPPSTQRLFKGIPISFEKIAKAFIPPLSELSDEIQNKSKHYNDDVELYTKREYFSDEFLKEIKNKAKSENEKYIISNNQIIISFLLKKYHNIILPNTDKIRLRNGINLRDVHPDIDSLHLGNATFTSTTEFTKDEINKMSLPQIAYRLKETITNMRNENFIKELSYLSEYGIDYKADILKKYYHAYNVHTDVNSTNLTHLNDLESLGLSSNIVSILDLSTIVHTGFVILKEKRGKIFAEITSRYPVG